MKKLKCENPTIHVLKSDKVARKAVEGLDNVVVHDDLYSPVRKNKWTGRQITGWMKGWFA